MESIESRIERILHLREESLDDYVRLWSGILQIPLNETTDQNLYFGQAYDERDDAHVASCGMSEACGRGQKFKNKQSDGFFCTF